MQGKMKNQTVKEPYTIIVRDMYGEDIINQTVYAENSREAVCKVFSFLHNPQKKD